MGKTIYSFEILYKLQSSSKSDIFIGVLPFSQLIIVPLVLCIFFATSSSEKPALTLAAVNDICNLAMVHRTTFYSHFSDKYELLDYCINDIENELTKNFEPKKYSTAKEFYSDLFNHLLNYLGENKLFFKNMLNNNYTAGIITVFHNSVIKSITELIEKENNAGKYFDVPTKIMAEFYAGAVTSIITWWLKSNSKISETALCNYIITLIFDGQK